MQNTKSFLFWAGFVLLMVGFFVLIASGIKNVNGQEDSMRPISVQDLRDFEHELTMKEGGNVDIWVSIKRLINAAERDFQSIETMKGNMQKMEQEIDKIKMDKRVFRNNDNPPAVSPKQEPKISMISNEHGQSIRVNGDTQNTSNWTPGQPVVMNYWGGQSRKIPYNGCKVMHKTRPNREQSDAYRYTNYAYQQGGRDMMLLWNAENGSRNPKQQSNVIFANGNREPSFGFCQLLKQGGYNANAIADERFFSDPFRQLDRCTEKYEAVKNKGNVWYARPHREKRGTNLYLVCE